MTSRGSRVRRLIRFMDRRMGAAKEARTEVAFHIDMRSRELEATGLDPAAARTEARRRFGDVASVQDECRRLAARRNLRSRRITWLEDAHADTIHALRQLRRAPALTLAIVLTLALGIGANTAIFSVVNALLFRPLPVPQADRLFAMTTEIDGHASGLSFLDVRDLRGKADDEVEVAASILGAVGLARGGDAAPERIAVHYVTGNLFSVLRLDAVHGRVLEAHEGWVAGADPVVVLTWAYWQRQFGRDPEAINSTVRINGRPFTIVGVTPPAFHGLNALLSIDAFLPISTLDPSYQQYAGLLDQRTNRGLTGLARLAESVTPSRAQASLDAALTGLVEPPSPVPQSRLVPEIFARPQASSAPMVATIATVFMILVVMVLLVACLNAAGILLVRATRRRTELAIRSALGASRARLVRHLLTEGAVLAVLGGGAGVGLGAIAGWALGHVQLGGELPTRFDFQLDTRVLAFSLLTAFASATIVGLLPAWRVARGPIAPQQRPMDGPQAQRLREILVATQIAGALVTLVVAGLFAHSLIAAGQTDLGFRPDPVLNVSMDVGFGGLAHDDGRLFYERLLERASKLPGVRSAAYGHATPLGYYWLFANPVAEGAEGPATTTRSRSSSRLTRSARYNAISPGYFETLGMPLLSGRGFDHHDDTSRPGVAVVNQTLAKHLWGDIDVLGKRFRPQQASGPWLQVVGVVADAKYQSLLEPPRPYFYRPLRQEPHRLRVLHLRTDGGAPEQLAPSVRDAIHDLDPTLPVFDLMPMNQSLDGLFGTFLPRWAALLASTFGLLALALAVLGVYAVVAFVTTHRQREIGIRLALGAERRQVVAMIVRQGAVPIIPGLAAGAIIAAFIAPRLDGLLIDTATRDMHTWLGAGLLLIVVALVAAALPAYRAAGINPATTVRTD